MPETSGPPPAWEAARRTSHRSPGPLPAGRLGEAQLAILALPHPIAVTPGTDAQGPEPRGVLVAEHQVVGGVGLRHEPYPMNRVVAPVTPTGAGDRLGHRRLGALERVRGRRRARADFPPLGLGGPLGL